MNIYVPKRDSWINIFCNDEEKLDAQRISNFIASMDASVAAFHDFIADIASIEHCGNLMDPNL